jgi:hypothetical protein
MTPGRALQYLPSCDILAGVMLDLNGARPAWNGCLGYPGGFDREHFRRCLAPIPERSTCPLLIRNYRQGLMAADRYGQLPPGYSDPDCETVAAAIAAPEPSSRQAQDTTPHGGEQPGGEPPRQIPPQWVKCLNYDPGNVETHMKQCLGPDVAAFRTCESVQRGYEDNLRAAYNGLPAGYVKVTCPQAQAIIAYGAAQKEEKRKEEEAARKARAEEARVAQEQARQYAPPREPQPLPRIPAPGPQREPREKSGSWMMPALIAGAILAFLLLWLLWLRSAGEEAPDWGESERGWKPPWSGWGGGKSSSAEKPDLFDFTLSGDTGTGGTDQPAKKTQDETRPPSEPEPQGRAQISDPFGELERMVGLAAVKKQVAELAALVKYQQQRKAAGLAASPQSYHLVFTGNPGTGKTSVAGIVGAIYRSLGVLKKGHLVEVGRKDLLGQNWGSGGEKTAKAIERALDGILFIDEAYALSIESGSGDPLGQEAIAALIDAMERNRDRLAVIAAGYTKEMDRFFAANPGLASRFGTRIEFPDYQPEELLEIFRRICAAQSYRLTPAAQAKLMLYVQALYQKRRPDFGNGREMRNLFEKSVRRLAARLSGSGKTGPADLVTLTEEDIPDAAER